jgi:hypothetical protein
MAMEVEDLAELDASLAALEASNSAADFELEAAAAADGLNISLDTLEMLAADGTAEGALPVAPPTSGALATKAARRPDSKKRKSGTAVRKGAAGSSNKSAVPKSALVKKRADEDDPSKHEDDHPFKVCTRFFAKPLELYSVIHVAVVFRSSSSSVRVSVALVACSNSKSLVVCLYISAV